MVAKDINLFQALKRSKKKLFIGFSILSVLFLTLFVIWCKVVIDSLSLSIFAPIERAESTQSLSQVDEGSLIRPLDLFHYLLVSDPVGPRQGRGKWANAYEMSSSKLRDNRPKVVNKAFTLPPVLKNTCRQNYCFQARTAFSELPSIIWKGLIGIEDYRFLSHKGVDPKSMARAIVVDIKEMRMAQGGSTITQQLVKNLFLNSKKTLTRKLKEMVISLYLEKKMSKEKILEAYFNEIFWGAMQGVRLKGIYAASIFYFEKRPSQLSEFEALILISLLKGPYFYHPIRKLDRLKGRVNSVYQRMVQIGLVSKKLNPFWTDRQWLSWQNRLKWLQKERPWGRVWPQELAQSSVLNHYERFQFYYQAEKLLRSLKSKYPGVDFGIKALIGRLDSDGEGSQDFAYYSKIERKRERAISGEFHNVGSTLKPIIYATYAGMGKSMDDEVDATPFKIKLATGITWSPKEAHAIGKETISIKEALQKSYNGPVLHLAREVGFDRLEEKLKKMVPRLKIPLKEYPAQLLGAVELSLSELNNLYKGLIRNQCRQMEGEGLEWEKSLIFQLSDPNSTTLAKVLARPIKHMRFFGKTGTSNQGLDNWFVFFDGQLMASIWVGVEGKRSQASHLRLYGSTTAFQLIQNFLLARGKRFNELNCLTLKKRAEVSSSK